LDIFEKKNRGVTRLEGLSDAVFAFSATLLVVSLEVPRTFDELLVNLGGFVGFGFSFALLMMIWTAHHGFFKRYGLEDRLTIAINSVLLFLVLFYVYPLKFLMSLLTGWYLGLEDVRGRISSLEEMSQLLLLYSCGFVAVYLCFVLLYFTAVKKRQSLELDELEVFDGRTLIRHYSIFVSVGVVSIVMTLTGVGMGIGAPGWIYALLGPLCGIHGHRRLKRRQALEDPGL